MSKQLKRGDVVETVFPGEPKLGRRYRVTSSAPENNLSPDRVDICDLGDDAAFKSHRGIGMPVKYLRVVQKEFHWKIYRKDNREVWYDRHQRLWVMQTKDADGNQVGECEYDGDRAVAMRFLNDTTIYGQNKK